MAKAKSKKMVCPEHKLCSTHAGHGKHLCELVAKRRMAQVAKLSSGAKYLCNVCGRAAARADNLCEPVMM